MAKAALESGEDHLAADLLGELERGASGDERAFYSALRLSAEGRGPESVAALQELFERAKVETFEPSWAWSDLVERVARQRLATRREEDQRRLEEVLSRHYEALGGLDMLRSLESMVAYGKLRSGSGELSFRLARRRPRFYRLDLVSSVGWQIEGSDGQTPWGVVVSESGVEGSHLQGPPRERLLVASYFDDVLVRYRETGERLYLAGKETTETGEVYRIEIDGPKGRRETSFLDAATLLETKRMIWDEPGASPVVISLEHAEVEGRPLSRRQIVETAEGILELSFERYDFTSEIDLTSFDLESVRRKAEGRETSGSD
ncbi:MAG TPA: hypothetical protein VNB06_20610, partial [Thermoanaerobaculia bacterium]|nr:hypothetical protein [Thermoanaerobaculia bacterium]